MKKWFNSDSRVFFNIILALIVGVIFGNFLGSSMLKNDAIYANANNYTDDVYILQSGAYYDELTATNALDEMKALGLNGIVVREHNNFNVYHGISTKMSNFDQYTKILQENDVNYLIKSRKLYYMLNDLDPSSKEYEFYYDSINYYLSLIHDTNVVIQDDYIDQVSEVNLELYNNMNLLNESINTDLALIYKLYVYKSLVDILL